MKNGPGAIVISGAALVSPLGLSRQAAWDGIVRMRRAIGPMTAMEASVPPDAQGGQAPDLPEDFAPNLPREARYLNWTVKAAIADAALDMGRCYPPERCATILGTTLHGMRAAGRFLRGGDFAELRTFLAGETIEAALGDLPLSGMAATTCSACSSSMGSIALGVTLLETGRADLVIAGGYDTISEYAYGGFNSLRLISPGNLRPFCVNRQGMKLAEGYGAVVLERASDVAARGGKVFVKILGWGESADAHHLTQPHPRGEGAARAIRAALSRAAVAPSQIDLIAAHATGTPDNDAGEYAAFSTVFEAALADIPVVAFKSHLGHTLGGAGAVELILSAMALERQVVPATANVKAEEIEFPGLSVTHTAARAATLRRTLNTSLGFGGANTCIILGTPQGDDDAPEDRPRPDVAPCASSPSALTASRGVNDPDVFITGIGVILPGAIGNDALLARLREPIPPAWTRSDGRIEESDFTGLLSARRVRRMSDYVKLTLAATTLACRDAGVEDAPAFAQDCAAILGTMHGASIYSAQLYELIVRQGLAAANPMLFAESVPNVAAAQTSLMLSMRGGCQTIIGTRTAALDALALATLRIRSGATSRAIVAGGEEYGELAIAAYRACGLAAVDGAAPFVSEGGFVAGSGAVVMILESRASMTQRGWQRAHGRIDRCAAARGDRGRASSTVGNVLKQLGGATHVISSACATWIDRAELTALRKAGAAHIATIYGPIAETFSVMPLAAIAAALLGGRLPDAVTAADAVDSSAAMNWSHGMARASAVRLASPSAADGAAMSSPPAIDRETSTGVICTDFTGAVSGITVSRMVRSA